MSKYIATVTACAAGITHTYMAVESLEQAGERRGDSVRVETQGSIGAENVLSEQEIGQADVIIVAVDIDIDCARFAGKHVMKIRSVDVIKDANALVERALNKTTLYDEKGGKAGNITLGKTESPIIEHAVNGISYMVLMCIAAGLLLMTASVFASQENGLGRIVSWGFDSRTAVGYSMQKLFMMGQTSLRPTIPLFAGLVMKSIVDKPAIAPVMIGAYIANDPEFLGTQTDGDFLSAILVALIVGYFIKGMKHISWPEVVQPLTGIMIILLVSTLVVMIITLLLIGQSIAFVMDVLYSGLTTLNEQYAAAPFIIRMIIGAMVGSDFGGLVNKTTLIFGTAVFTGIMTKYGVQGANSVPQSTIQAVISVAPFGIWLVSVTFKNKFSRTERISTAGAFGMRMVGITEGVIPSIAANLLQMITANVVGFALAEGLITLTGCKFYGGVGLPLGVFIGYIEWPMPFITWTLYVLAGTVVTALIVGFWRKSAVEKNE